MKTLSLHSLMQEKTIDCNSDIQIINLTEARRNPDKNKRVSAYEALLPYKDNPDMYISFTAIDKIGINPKSRYNTPLGIYCYPLKEIWENYAIDIKKSIGKSVPFAGKHPYIWLLEKKSGTNFIEDLYTTYTSKEYDRDIVLLGNYIAKMANTHERVYENLIHIFSMSPLETFTNDDWVRLYEERGRRMAKIKSPSGIIWFIIYSFSEILEIAGIGKAPVQWNKMLRVILGYDGVADKSGKGIIHGGEPIQAIFLHKRAFNVVAEFLNKDYDKLGEIGWRKWLAKAETKDAEYEDKDGQLVWLNGLWIDGSWEGGTWESGMWESGIWKGGTWRNGFWKDGYWYRGSWYDGTWNKGSWQEGVWYQGTWEDGEWDNGKWVSGIWKNGVWDNGTWYGGRWEDGMWREGIWKKGNWIIGWIRDPNRKGNFDLSWEWNGNYVRSPISPKEYFEGVK